MQVYGGPCPLLQQACIVKQHDCQLVMLLVCSRIAGLVTCCIMTGPGIPIAKSESPAALLKDAIRKVCEHTVCSCTTSVGPRSLVQQSIQLITQQSKKTPVLFISVPVITDIICF